MQLGQRAGWPGHEQGEKCCLTACNCRTHVKLSVSKAEEKLNYTAKGMVSLEVKGQCDIKKMGVKSWSSFLALAVLTLRAG